MSEPEKQDESRTRTCPQCGAELSADVPDQPCPACLMKLGLASWQSREDAGDLLEPTRDSKRSAFKPPAPEELSGRLPNLEVLTLLGHGGMGAVYKARQTSLDRLVAIKLIRPDVVEVAGFAERFTREARALAKLNHPNIVTVHDFGKVTFADDTSGRDAQLYYLVMEFVEGTDLRHLIQQGDLTPQQALTIVPPLCEALQFAHDAGIVHRDIKPENILLDTNGRVKIADFGLARLADSEASAFTLTGTRQIMGTLRYMAPEQMEGSHDVDHRADIYSLGVVFYEMLTGQVPAGHFDPPSKMVQVDVRLDEVVLRALAREPGRRYQHVSEVKTDVETISRPESPGRDFRKGEAAANAAGQDQTAAQSIDVEAVRRRVRGPAIALALYALTLLLPAALLLTNGVDIADGNDGSPWYFGGAMIAASAGMVVLIGIVIRGVWHLLNLEKFNAAFLAAILGQPVGLWGLAVLGHNDVKQSFEVGPARRKSTPFPWAVFFTEFLVLTSVFALAVFAMAWEQSALPVYLLVIPWMVMSGFGAYHDGTPEHRGTMANFVYGTVWSVGLLAFAVTLTGSQALLAVLLCIVGMVFGAGLGSAIRAEDSSDANDDRSAVNTQAEPVEANAKRGERSKAWDVWWQKQNPSVAKVTQTLLSIVFIVCLVMYLSFQNTSTLETAEDGTEYRHTTITYGSPGPWFEYDVFPKPGTQFGWQINFASSSMGLMLLGFLTYCVSWQIEKARAPLSGKKLRWLCSPSGILTLWWVASAIGIGVAMVQPSLLTLMYDGIGRSSNQATASSGEKNAEAPERPNGLLRPAEEIVDAAQEGRFDVVSAMLRAGADANFARPDGLTTLFVAVQFGSQETVTELLDAGADPNRSAYDGVTPLILASAMGRTEIVRQLIEAKADLNAREGGFGGVLVLRSKPGSAEQDFEHFRSPQQTALFPAIMHSHDEIVTLLLEAGADPTLKDKQGRSAVVMAELFNQGEFVEQVKSFVAHVPDASDKPPATKPAQ